jgi:hypothetical protein
MNIAKSVLLLAGLMIAGSIFAQGTEEGWGRHARKPGDVILTQEMQLLEASFLKVNGCIDADVLDFHHEIKET